MNSISRHHKLGSAFLYDASDALTALAKQPGFAATAVLTLALGIGACTVIFSAVNAILLRPLPYRDADRLVRIHGNFSLLKMENLGVRPREFLDYQQMNHVFAESAAFEVSDFSLTGSDLPERVRGAFASKGLFDLLGVRQKVGRLFDDGEYEQGRNNVAIISDSLWADRYGRAGDTLGSQMIVNGTAYAIVGVLPRDFAFQHLAGPVADPIQVWIPLAFTKEDLEHGGWSLDFIGRLSPGVTLDQARADIALIANGFTDRYPGYRGPHGEDGGWRATLIPLKDEAVSSVRASLLVLLGAVGVLLLIACANVANLLLGRGLERHREIAIRSALGAGRLRILSKLLIENLIIALLGAGTGVLVAWWARDLLVAAGAGSIPRVDEIRLDARVLAFSLLLAILTPVLFGLVPALKLSAANLADSLKQNERSAGAGRSSVRSALVIAEVGLSLMLLIGAGLLMKSFVSLRRVDLGFNPDGVVTARIDLPDSKYHEALIQADFFQRVLGLLGPAAAVESSSLFTSDFRDPFSIDDRPFDSSNPSTAFHLLVGPRYFATLQIPLLRGREFTDGDSIGSPGVAVINKALADRFFGGQDPLGHKIKVGASSAGHFLTIVGVASDVRGRGPIGPPQPFLYMAYQQAPLASATLAVRCSGDINRASAAIRGAVAAIDKEQPAYRIESFRARLAESIAQPRLDALLLSVFSLMALTLALGGVYVIISYSVSQRTHEIGIRMALGATRLQVTRSVLRHGLTLTIAGIAVGTIGALLSTRLLSSLLFNVSATDPLTFASVPLLLAVTGFLACLKPALTASRLDPLKLLRRE